MRKVFIVMSLAALMHYRHRLPEDKGFENNEYGINGADNSPAGMAGFQRVTFKLNLGLDLSPDPQVIDDQAVIMLSQPIQPRTTSPLQWPSMKRSLTTTTPKNGTNIIALQEGTDFTCLRHFRYPGKEPSK